MLVDAHTGASADAGSIPAASTFSCSAAGFGLERYWHDARTCVPGLPSIGSNRESQGSADPLAAE